MSELEEIREKLIKLDSFIQENKNIEKRLPIHNMDDLKIYYNHVRDILIDELKFEGNISIPKMIASNKMNVDARTTLIVDSSLREQNALIDMFNKDLGNGYFNGSILQDGIFFTASKSKDLKTIPDYLYLNPEIGRPFYNMMHMRFIFDKNALMINESLEQTIRNNLRKHLFRTNELSPTEYGLIREYFLETAPFVLNCLLLKFKDEYISAKRENLPVVLTSAMVNTGTNSEVVLVLETLYNELLKQDIFKDTIFEDATTSTSLGQAKLFNPILMDPVTESAPLKQYNLRLFINTHILEEKSEKRLCYNNPR